MRYKNLTLIGTSHIAKESVEKVKKFIEEKEVGIVCVELDKRRYIALMKGGKGKVRWKDIKRIGVTGFMFNVIGGYIEKKLGKMVGVEPGAEMIAAIKAARRKKIKVGLIDQDIEITLRRFSKEFTFKEKMRMGVDLVKGVLFKKRELRKLGINEIDLSKVPGDELIRKMVKYVKKRYPNFHRVLIEERNYVMARNLVAVMNNFPDDEILAVVGAGHGEELLELIKKKDI